MYVTEADAIILHSLTDLRIQYAKKFGERFIAFNYIDFPGIKDVQRPAEMYREALIEALKKDEPTRIESHWFDFCDH